MRNENIFISGFLGEKTTFKVGWTFIVKDHMFVTDSIKDFESIIFLVRNPYDAHIAEYNLKQTENQLGSANESDFFSSGKVLFLRRQQHLFVTALNLTSS